MTKTPNTGVDQSTVAVIKFPQADGRIIHGTLTCALDSQTPGKRCVLVEGSLGFLEIQWCVFFFVFMWSEIPKDLMLMRIVTCRATYRPESISYSTWKSIAEYNSGSVTPDKSESISFATRPGLFSCSFLVIISPVTDHPTLFVRRRSLGIHLGGR